MDPILNCPHFINCPACKYESIFYSKTLVKKQNYLSSLFNQAIPVKASCEIKNFRIRAKLRYLPKYGFGIFDSKNNKVLTIDTCKIHHETINSVLKVLNNFFHKHPNKHLRFCHLNYCIKEKKVLVVFGIHQTESIDIPDFIKNNPLISGIYFGKSKDNENSLIPSDYIHLCGDKYFYITNSVAIHPACFVQSNFQTYLEHVTQLGNLANFSKKDQVLDLFAGISIPNIYFSNLVSQWIINEQNPFVDKSPINRTKNSLINCGDALSCLKDNKDSNLLLVNPPYKGLKQKLCTEILNHQEVEQIFYTSCNPISLIDDLSLLKPQFKVKSIQAFDFFPWTDKFETLVQLVRK